ncbi:MAG: bifunctional folylpolyglutamate synthase/dihydrofolate synthase [Eubacteriales bacterium]|nr:bifunctional folylpolyglutamate synthase/dihydrofolate synthase [Eubacteriales bacterium]MDD4476128.1 bifunctional folylpolyglutamate synthase/dihydrofolate synthase [Eubacteriales bacterium]
MEYNFSYEQAMNYIHSIGWRGSRLGLERTKELLFMMGNPEKKLKFIHVAGTNGKGSVCAMLSSVLTEAGYKTGRYTSPYIERFNERICIDGEPISDDELAVLTGYVAEFAEKMSDHPTEFELITAVGFEYFKRKNCEIVILEVGLGGELDSTNVIDSPIAAVITALGLDHTTELGDSIEMIAAAKAGIIKPGTSVVYYGSEKAADDVIAAKCKKVDAKLKTPDYSQIKLITSDERGLVINYKNYKHITIPLMGEYQQKNAAIVLEVIDIFTEKGYALSETAIRDGIAKTLWPARFEKLHKNPTLIFDGGHNPQGVKAAIGSLNLHFPGKKAVLVVGIMRDKNVDGVLSLLAPYADKLFAVTPDNPRSLDSHELCKMATEHGINAVNSGSVKEGIDAAIGYACDTKIILAIGSLYMYSEVKKALAK